MFFLASTSSHQISLASSEHIRNQRALEAISLMRENVRLIKNNNKKNWKSWVPLIGKYSKDVIGNMCKAAKWSIAVVVGRLFVRGHTI